MSEQTEPKAIEATTIEEAEKVGYFGTEVDPTPNEHYTLRGVGKRKPTPETDAGQRAAVREYKESNGL